MLYIRRSDNAVFIVSAYIGMNTQFIWHNNVDTIIQILLHQFIRQKEVAHDYINFLLEINKKEKAGRPTDRPTQLLKTGFITHNHQFDGLGVMTDYISWWWESFYE